MDDTKILMIAFDGLDHELIKKFELDHITQKHFGKIDNSTDIPEIKTPMLFASLITGNLPAQHKIGLRGFNTYNNPKIRELEKTIARFPLSEKFFKIRKALYQKTEAFDQAYLSMPKKEEIESKTILDEVNNSKSIFLPSYNNVYDLDYITEFSQKSNVQVPKLWDRHFHPYRKKELFKEINKYYDLFICHFHRPDLHQHYYGDEELEATFDMEKLEKLYNETDKLAKEILEFFSDDYDIILFLSDHGTPTEEEHNENAFYSSNIELFDENPHITDFYDKIRSIK